MRYRGQQLPYDPQRKVRAREHITADLSYNFLEWKVLQRGHWLDAPRILVVGNSAPLFLDRVCQSRHSGVADKQSAPN